MVANSYYQYIWSEFVLPDLKSEKIMGKYRKRIKYDDISTEEGHYNSMHKNSLY